MKEETGLVTDTSHHAMLASSLDKLRLMGALCDVTLTCDGAEEINAHKVVLAACSEYFQAMFTSGMCEQKKSQVSLKGVDKKSLGILVDYAYTGQLKITQANVQRVLETANLLQFLSAKQLCCQYIMQELTADNCLDMFNFAEVYHCQDVLALSQQVFNKNWKKIVHLESFAGVDFHVFVKLITSNALQVTHEIDVLRIILYWIEADAVKRVNLLYKLLDCVRWPFIAPVELNEIRKHPLLTTDNEIRSHIECVLNSQNLLPKINEISMRESYRAWMHILGGEQSFLSEMKSCEYYNQQRDQWSYGFSLQTPRTSFAAIILGEKLYVLGGVRFGEKLKLIECYDQHTARWKKLASLKKCQGDVEAAVIDDVIYVAGGSSGGEPACRYVERYDESNNQWHTVAPMKSRRRRFGMVEHRGSLYVFGGFQDSLGELRVCETYSPETNAWEPIASMKTNRCELGVTVLSDFIYVTGGVNSYAGSISTVERYDPSTDTWCDCKPLTHARGGHAMVTYFGRAVAIGGMNSYMQTCKDAEAYNEVTDEWNLLPHTNIPRFGAVGIILPFYKHNESHQDA